MNDVVIDEKARATKTVTMVCYALHALGPFTGGLTSIAALIVNYIKLDQVRGTWFDSHFRWQIRTFWFTLLWSCLIVLFVIVSFGLAIFVMWIPITILTVWYIYRVAKGWLYLYDERAMYALAMPPPAPLQPH